jgi:hypothetical protein
VRDLLASLRAQFSSPQVWIEQAIWTAVFAAIVRLFLWIVGVGLDSDRELAYWVAAPLTAMLGFSVLRGLGGRPELHGNIEQVSVGEVEDGTSILSVWMAIRNLGARPSAATHWRIHVRVADSTVTSDVVPIQFGGAGVRIAIDDGESEIVLPHSEFLHNKAALGILGGGYMVGVLVGAVPDGIRADDMLKAGGVVSVSFRDIHGKKLEAKHIMTGLTGAQKWIPGIKAAIGKIPDGGKNPAQLPAPKSGRRRGKGKRPH